jgi:hypothetical protein
MPHMCLAWIYPGITLVKIRLVVFNYWPPHLMFSVYQAFDRLHRLGQVLRLSGFNTTTVSDSDSRRKKCSFIVW